MSDDLPLIMTATLAIGFAVVAGPLQFAVRAVLRKFTTRALLLRWQNAVTLGTGVGLIGATALCGFVFGGQAAVVTATLGTLLLLAVLDLAWRWLPLEWTVPILVLGIIQGVHNGALAEAMIGLGVGAGTLLLLQLTFQFWRGIRALGTGDIWLAAGLGALAGMPEIGWILSLSAISSLLAALLAKSITQQNKGNRMGVAYGAHLCGVYAILLVF